jgi:hypothetical protein
MSKLGPDNSWSKQASNRLVSLYKAWGKPAKAAEYTAR